MHPFFSAKPITVGQFVPSPVGVCHFLHLDPFGSNDAGLSSSPSSISIKTESIPTPSTIPTQTDNRANSVGNGNSDGVKKVEIVFYDLDGTLIKTRSGSDFPTNRSDWQWWDPTVPAHLKKEWEDGKHLVILSNQGDAREKIRSEWKAKLPLIATKVSPPTHEHATPPLYHPSILSFQSRSGVSHLTRRKGGTDEADAIRCPHPYFRCILQDGQIS